MVGYGFTISLGIVTDFCQKVQSLNILEELRVRLDFDRVSFKSIYDQETHLPFSFLFFVPVYGMRNEETREERCQNYLPIWDLSVLLSSRGSINSRLSTRRTNGGG